MTDQFRRMGLKIRYAVFALCVAIWLPFSMLQAKDAHQAGKLNVLCIVVDDLRPRLGCYGDEDIRSPQVDRLAKNGMLFTRAYCQQAICAPSRASFITGLRPDTTRVYDLRTHFRKALPDVVTLPQHFKNNGYITQALGKIHHVKQLDKPSWSEGQWFPTEGSMVLHWAKEENNQLRQDLMKEARAKGQDLKIWQALAPATECADVPDNAYPDGMIADKAVELLEKYRDKRFFLAVGFIKPHLPFAAPKKYWDMYKREDFVLADNPFKPRGGIPAPAWYWSGELRNYYGMPKKDGQPFTEPQMRELLHGYAACVSFVDAQIGRLLDALDKFGLRENTVVVLWGDHGWHLGEHNIWGKMTNFEESTRVPFIVSYPGMKHKGAKLNAFVELVDIYPTLSELCGLPMPKLEGTSMVPVLASPERKWKKAAFSQYPRNLNAKGQGRMGYSIRTDRYRYTEWRKWDDPSAPALLELYDHKNDPGENHNLAGDAASKKIIQNLSRMLQAGWQGAVPE